MKTLIMPIRVTFTMPILGSLPGNKDTLFDYLSSNVKSDTDVSPVIPQTAEEKLKMDAAGIETTMADHPEAALEKATTIFPKDENGFYLCSHQLKGFIKAAMLVACDLGISGAITKYSHKSAIDSLVFTAEPRMNFRRADNYITEPDEYNGRPLRAETMQGERVSLARSMQINAGATVDATLLVLMTKNAKSKLSGSIDQAMMEQLLDYGHLRGLLQWRNAGYGSFTWDYTDDPRIKDVPQKLRRPAIDESGGKDTAPV